MDASAANGATKTLLQTVREILLMASQTETLYNDTNAGFGLLNMLLETPEQFDDLANKLKASLKNFDKKAKRESQTSPAIKQLLETKQCAGCNLSKAQLSYRDLSKTTVEKADLTQAWLNYITAEEMHAKDAVFNKANLDHAVFIKSDCTSASFEDADLKSAYFEACPLDKTKWHEAHLTGTVFQDITASGLDLSSVHFAKTLFGLTPMIINSKISFVSRIKCRI